jgi:hypothetical protein
MDAVLTANWQLATGNWQERQELQDWQDGKSRKSAMALS